MRRLPVMMLVAALVLGACTSDDDDAADTTTSSSTTTTSASTTSTTIRSTTTVTAPLPTGEELADGRHAVYLTGLDTDGHTLTVNVIQFLSGQAAIDAYHEDEPDDPEGPPNDYYIVDDNPRLRTLPVADDVTVRLVFLRSGVDLDPGTWEGLPTYLEKYRPDDGRLSFMPFWITVAGDRITAIQEQYVP